MVSVLLDRHVAEGRGERTAIKTPEKSITYRELNRLTNRVGNALRTLGVEMEQRVALLLPDSPSFIAAFLGAMKIGAVPVPLNTLAGPADFEYFLNDSRAKVLVVGAALFHNVELIRSRCSSLKHVIVDGEEIPGALAFDRLVGGQQDDLEPAHTHHDDPAYWLYSSGTTGRPKGVVHLHRDMVSCVSAYAQHVLNLGADDLLFSVPRLFFSYGLVNSLYIPLWSGAASLLSADRPDPTLTLRLITQHRPTIFFSVPTSYTAILNEIERRVCRQAGRVCRQAGGADYDFGSLRLAISAGEALPVPLLERWRNVTGVEILDGIGTTEVGYIFISNRPGRVRPGSSGEVVPGYDVKIVAEDGAEVGPGVVGDLLVKAESGAAYYWHQREKSRETFQGEWLRTGDKYVKEADGYYFYVGRADDLFKVSGHWVSPIEIEERLLQHPAVSECAVVGVRDESGLMKPKAYVVLREGSAGHDQLVQELHAFVREKLPPFKTPQWISLVPGLPKTATGKIERFKLRVQ